MKSRWLLLLFVCCVWSTNDGSLCRIRAMVVVTAIQLRQRCINNNGISFWSTHVTDFPYLSLHPSSCLRPYPYFGVRWLSSSLGSPPLSSHSRPPPYLVPTAPPLSFVSYLPLRSSPSSPPSPTTTICSLTHLHSIPSSSATSSPSTAPVQDDASRSRAHAMYNVPPGLADVMEQFNSLPEDKSERARRLCVMGKRLPSFPDAHKTITNKVMGCQSLVHIVARARRNPEDGLYRIYLGGDSDGLVTKGLLYLMISGLSGSTLSEITALKPEFGALIGLQHLVTMSRINGFMNMTVKMQFQARQAVKLAKRVESAGASTSG
eukprot:GHVS01064023.1.p1 GENE.GHVS01064023.1~~GHVS01064023.1.p1  ORF type:complete len:320 (+),score=35.73 GHVS01064023.1:18-977(+)